MKTVKALFLTIIVATLAFSACKKGNDEDPTFSEPFLRAKINGTAHESTTEFSSGQVISDKVLLEGTDSMFSSIRLYFKENLAIGTYSYNGIFGNDVGASFATNGVIGSTYDDISGSFTILEYDTVANSIKGTFNFVAVEGINKDTVYVTDGEFFMEYQQ